MTVSCERPYKFRGYSEYVCHWNGTWLPANNVPLHKFKDWPRCERKCTNTIFFLNFIRINFLIYFLNKKIESI